MWRSLRQLGACAAALPILPLLPAAGCARSGPTPAPRTPVSPLSAPCGSEAFDGSRYGIRLLIPAGWRSAPTPDYLLRLVPSTSPDPAEAVELTLDVPPLPFHIPGWIPIGRVEQGYIDDQKAGYPDLRVVEANQADVPGAKARRVRTSRGSAAGERLAVAYLLVRGDRVYILRAEAGLDSFPAAQAALEHVLQTLQWI